MYEPENYIENKTSFFTSLKIPDVIERKTNKLMNFERKITRKIFRFTRTDDGYWRIKTNQEINDILKEKIYNWFY